MKTYEHDPRDLAAHIDQYGPEEAKSLAKLVMKAMAHSRTQEAYELMNALKKLADDLYAEKLVEALNAEGYTVVHVPSPAEEFGYVRIYKRGENIDDVTRDTLRDAVDAFSRALGDDLGSQDLCDKVIQFLMYHDLPIGRSTKKGGPKNPLVDHRRG